MKVSLLSYPFIHYNKEIYTLESLEFSDMSLSQYYWLQGFRFVPQYNDS